MFKELTTTTTSTSTNNKKIYLESIKKYIRDKEATEAEKRMAQQLKEGVTELVVVGSVLSKKLTELVVLLLQPEGDDDNVAKFLKTLYAETFEEFLHKSDHCVILQPEEILCLMSSFNVKSKNSIYSMEIEGKGKISDFFISRNTLNITTARKVEKDTYVEAIQVYPQQNSLES